MKSKLCYIFEYQSNEKRAFRFFGTPGISALRLPPPPPPRDVCNCVITTFKEI